MNLTGKAKFAPSFEVDVAKNFEWWEAETDRAIWEHDQLTQEQLQEREMRLKKIQSIGGGLLYWTPPENQLPYITKSVWK